MGTTNILDLNNRVNKLESKHDSGGTAEDTTYDNTESGLSAENVQAAIDELAGDIAGLSADDVDYDNTDSGLTADTVQGAIDEVAGDISELSANDVSYDNTTSGLVATTVQGAIDEVNTRVVANTLGTAVDIKGMTGYTCPSDGYVRFKNDGSTTGNTYLSVQFNNETMLTAYAQHIGYYEVLTLFAKKGMTIKDNGSTLSDYFLEFIPISLS